MICIGDSGNDVSMLEEAGLSVVMGNAPDFIKEYGDYITDTNENDGVAKAIERLLYWSNRNKGFNKKEI